MTDKEKLQRLFDAALKDPSIPTGHTPKRAFPVTKLNAVPVPAATTESETFHRPTNTIPFLPVADLRTDAPQETSRPTMANVLDYAANAELVALMDEQRERKTRKHRMMTLGVAALALLGLTAGGFAWFMQSPPIDETTMGGPGEPALQKDSDTAATPIGDTHKATAAIVDDSAFDHEK